jgi:hypothetical protein
MPVQGIGKDPDRQGVVLFVLVAILIISLGFHMAIFGSWEDTGWNNGTTGPGGVLMIFFGVILIVMLVWQQQGRE